MNILAIDPGPERSAYLCLDHLRQPTRFNILSNHELCDVLVHFSPSWVLVVEGIASYGMAVGAAVFETCEWIGRFRQVWTGKSVKVYRGEVKMHLCGTKRSKDPNVRQVLIDQYGGSRQAAIGTKKNPGPLYGVSKDVWAALAVAVTYYDTRGSCREKASSHV